MGRLLFTLLLQPLRRLFADAADCVRIRDEEDRKQRNVLVALSIFSILPLFLLVLISSVPLPGPRISNEPKVMRPATPAVLTGKQWEELRANEAGSPK
jgi:hypothetical protein